MSDQGKTMAEVLAEHSIDTYQNQMHDETRWFCTNEGCAFETDNWHGVADREIAKHHEEALSAAGFGLVADAKAEALEEAVSDFESNVGTGEFAELSSRDGARWVHSDDAWEYQGPYMDWLRNRADSLRNLS